MNDFHQKIRVIAGVLAVTAFTFMSALLGAATQHDADQARTHAVALGETFMS